jgi:hypothetical protein
MEIAIDGPRDVASVENATVRRDVDDPQVGVVQVIGQPVDADERTGSVGRRGRTHADVSRGDSTIRIHAARMPNRPRSVKEMELTVT